MKVWIAKYALTRGIYEAEVVERGRGMVKDLVTCALYHCEGRDWHRTREPAVIRASTCGWRRH